MRTGLALLLVVTTACGARDESSADSAFADVQRRGASVMGVDQYTSQHVFESLVDGGRISLQRDDAADTAGIRVIRDHMRQVARDFREGNFSKPFGVHAQEVPGTAMMARRRGEISYTVEDLPRGAAVRIMATDGVTIAAIHEFLAFQRADHRAAGHESH